MIKALLLWLLNLVRGWIDPEYKQRVAEEETQRKATEAKEKAALEEISEQEKEITNIATERATITPQILVEKQKAQAIDERIRTVEEKHEKATDDVKRRSDADILRGDL